MIDVAAIRNLDDEAWEALWDAVLAESRRREVLATAPPLAEQAASDYLTARDGAQPERTDETLADASAWPEYIQPTGAHDAYPLGYVLTDGGRVWRSLIAANVWRPGSQGAERLWEDVTAEVSPPEPEEPTQPVEPGEQETPPEPEPTPSAPAWAAGVSYDTGDLVTYGGQVYRCVQGHPSQAGWEPPNVPALWARQS